LLFSAWARIHAAAPSRNGRRTGLAAEDCAIELCNGAVVRLVQAPSAKSGTKKSKGSSSSLDKSSDPALTGTT
jgi:hypothetical protein